MPKTDNVRQVDLPRATGGGSLYIRSGSSGGVSNADTVDGYHASSTPTAGKLLALDASAQFNPSVIEWADVAGAGLGASGDTLVVLWGTTPTTIQPDDAAAGGSAATSARSDHRHAIATAVPGTILPDDSANEGSATSFARSDHRHAITAAAPAANLSASTSNAEGSASSFSRSDHSHALTAYSDASVYPGHLLKSDANGDLKVRRLEASDRLIASLVTSAAGLTLQPTTDLVLDPDSNLAKVASGVRLQSDGYVSQTTGWGVAFNGAADLRYLYVDEMHAKAFVADLEQALAGGQIIAKSVAPLQQDFTVPAPGASEYLWVESFAGFPAAQVFQNGDTVMVRTFSRTGTSLTIGNAFGTVSGAFIVTGEGRQRWTFTRLSGTVNGHPRGGYMAAGTVVPRGTLALDFGVSGNGYYEVNAIDGAMGANSPYAQIVTWNAHPWYDRTVRTRYGNLYGVFATAGEYGMFAGEGAAASDQFLRLSNSAIEGHNLPIRLYDGTTQVVRIEPNAGAPYIGLGNPAPTSYLGATGIWMGKHSTAYKAHVGVVSGADISAGWKWDGATLTVKGNIYVTGGDAAKTDLSNVGANVVSGKVNADTTLIAPGRIQVYGSGTLADWRYGNTTTIDGGKIAADTVTAAHMLVHGANWISNPGFETGDLSGWNVNPTHGSPVISTGNPHSGAYYLVATGNGSTNLEPVWHTYTPVEAGRTYYFGVWVRNGTGSGQAGGYIQWYDASGGSLGFSNAFSAASTSWSKKYVVATAPSGATRCRTALAIRSDNSSGVAFDDVEFYQADGSLVVGTPTGARVQITSNGIEGYNSTPSKQFYIRTSDGRAGFGGDPPKGVLDSSGLVLSGNESSYNSYNAVRWMTATDPPGGNEVARVAAGGFVTGWEGDAGLHVYANPQGHLAQSAMRAQARAASASRYADMVLDASAKGGVAWLKAAGASYGDAFIEVNSLESSVLSSNWRNAGKRIVMGFDHSATSPTWQLTSSDMYMGGTITSSGQVNLVHPNIVLPVELLASVALTSSYQNVAWALQSFNDAFTAIAGRSYTSQTGWGMYWVLACKFSANPTTIRGALYHYTGGSWQYHSSTYTKTMYAGGINYVAFGPWALSTVSQTMTLHLKVDTGAGQSVGPNDGGVSYLIFRRS